MATLTMINGRNNALIGTKRVIDYILDPKKTTPELTYGKNCMPQNAFLQFKSNKMYHNKIYGRSHIHFVQSFKGKINENLALEIAREFLNHEKFDNFQVVCAIHTDTQNTHVHYVLDTVSTLDGSKYRQSKSELNELKDYSDTLMIQRGLPVVKRKTDKTWLNAKSYRSKIYARSYKYETKLAVNEALSVSTNKDEFISNLKLLGYNAVYSDARKYVTFTNEDGKKFRDKRLDKNFSKEYFENKFKENAQDENLKNNDFNKLLKEIDQYKKREDDDNKYPLTKMRIDKYQMMKDIFKTKFSCLNKDEFISKMQEQGYSVQWDENEDNITFINKEGMKFEDSRINENFSKENFQNEFDKNIAKGFDQSAKGLLVDFFTDLESGSSSGGYSTPLTKMEIAGELLKQKIAEDKKGRGLTFEK